MERKENGTAEREYAWIDFGYECDLHFFAPRETAAVLDEFIRQAAENGRTRIRLVHGKGRSAKKREAHAILSAHPDVRQFRDDGPNWGATIIILAARGKAGRQGG
ncbi:MAG: Smr/MutS family protein [Spirochaetes bacterium]|nr:Smr/MutS family protein [Spirochaetota bacterium]